MLRTQDHIGEKAAPTGLLADLLAEPIGIASAHPRLSWIVPALTASTRQAAYRLQLARSRADLAAERDLIWDSAWVASSASTSVELGGPGLAPDSLAYWRVAVTDQHGTRSSWSAPQRLVTAPAGWAAQPIWTKNDSGWLLARRVVEVTGEIEAAWIRATGQSPEPARQYVYRLALNGAFAGLGPVRSPDPGHETRTHSHDVTALLRPGRNALSALCYSGGARAFLAELVIVYRDGRRTVIGTDTQWRVRDAGAWRPLASFIGGIYYQAPQEDIDARAEPAGWTDADYVDSDWEIPALLPALPSPVPATAENIDIEIISPAGITELAPGHFLFDMGREIVGGLRLDIAARDGQRIGIRLGEERDEAGGARSEMRATHTYALGNTDANWGYRETWTLRDGPQRLEHWGYRGFRWAELIGPPGLDLASGLWGVVLRPAWREDDAAFSSSSPDLDRVWEMCRYSIAALRSDLYIDTPTRERGPYEGDAIVNQLSDYATQRSYALARSSTHYLLRRPTWPTEYRLLPPILAWRDYMETGDASALAGNYDLLVSRQLIGFLNPEGLVEKDPGRSSEPNGDLVDWPMANRDDFEFTAVNTVINAWQYAALDALARIAGVLGRDADATRFGALAARLREAARAKLRDPDGIFRDGLGSAHRSQHATAFALAFGLADPAAARDLAARGMRMSVYGAQFLLDALYRAGEAGAALALLTSRATYSWLHMMEQWNATIVMEAWDPAIKPNTTFSHAWGTAPVNVAARWIAGIEIVEPGAARLRITPRPGGLDHFDCVVPTIRGPVRLAYRRDGAPLLVLDLPPNVEAELDCIPDALAGIDPHSLSLATAPTRVESGRLVATGLGPGHHILQRP